MIAYVHFAETRPDGFRDTFQTVSAPVQIRPMWWHENGCTWTASGYGARIPTPYVIRLDGRSRRVYCRIYSNAGTLYIGRNLRTGQIVDIREPE